MVAALAAAAAWRARVRAPTEPVEPVDELLAEREVVRRDEVGRVARLAERDARGAAASPPFAPTVWAMLRAVRVVTVGRKRLAASVGGRFRAIVRERVRTGDLSDTPPAPTAPPPEPSAAGGGEGGARLEVSFRPYSALTVGEARAIPARVGVVAVPVGVLGPNTSSDAVVGVTARAMLCVLLSPSTPVGTCARGGVRALRTGLARLKPVASLATGESLERPPLWLSTDEGE